MLKTKWKNEKNFNISRYTEYVNELLIWYFLYDKLPFKLSKEDIKYCMKHFGTNKVKIIGYFMKKENIGSSERKQSKKSKNRNKR